MKIIDIRETQRGNMVIFRTESKAIVPWFYKFVIHEDDLKEIMVGDNNEK